MNCKNCRAEILPGRKFCTGCGAPVTETPLAIACAVCGGINPVEAKYCGDCGKALEADRAATSSVSETASAALESDRQTPAAERRQLTVLFSDLVGSTELSTRLDPEDLRDIVDAY
jgi:hypothetical protein